MSQERTETTEPHLSETARIARDLIRFDTSNRGNGDANPEADAAAYVAAYLAELGLEPTTIESEPGRASVVARVSGREPGLPALVLHGHLDVVPADPANWSVDPFAGEIRDGMLWGRGAVDMKDMDAMILTAIAELLRAGSVPGATSSSRSSPTRRTAGSSAPTISSTTMPNCSRAPVRRSARSAGTRSTSPAPVPT